MGVLQRSYLYQYIIIGMPYVSQKVKTANIGVGMV